MPAATADRTAVSTDAVRVKEFRAALEQALERAAADERIGPLIAATGLRMRMRFPDAGLVLSLASTEGSRGLVWSFGEVAWNPKFELTMDSATANRYLQGRESLAIAIARGQVSYRGESRTALLYLPAARLLCDPYREVIRAGFPDLVR